MDPSHLTRWLTSRVMTRLSRPAAVAARHRKAEQARVKVGATHRVEYFHQVDEGYSFLAAQMLERLAALEKDSQPLASPTTPSQKESKSDGGQLALMCTCRGAA